MLLYKFNKFVSLLFGNKGEAQVDRKVMFRS